jgi:hypothetical protein
LFMTSEAYDPAVRVNMLENMLVGDNIAAPIARFLSDYLPVLLLIAQSEAARKPARAPRE